MSGGRFVGDKGIIKVSSILISLFQYLFIIITSNISTILEKRFFIIWFIEIGNYIWTLTVSFCWNELERFWRITRNILYIYVTDTNAELFVSTLFLLIFETVRYETARVPLWSWPLIHKDSFFYNRHALWNRFFVLWKNNTTLPTVQKQCHVKSTTLRQNQYWRWHFNNFFHDCDIIRLNSISISPS